MMERQNSRLPHTGQVSVPALIIIFLLLCPLLRSQTIEELRRPSLKGLKRVTVSVDIAQHVTDPIQLNEEELRTAIELRLRTVGVKVVESVGQADAMLVLGVTTGQTVHESYISFLDLWVDQKVRLDRSLATSSLAKTWTEGTLLYNPQEKYQTEVRRRLDALLDKFLNAYLAVNPR
jgi:hypothetical protein